MQQNCNGIHLAEDWLDASKPPQSICMHEYFNDDRFNWEPTMWPHEYSNIGLNMRLGIFFFQLGCCVCFVLSLILLSVNIANIDVGCFYGTSDETIELKTLCCSLRLFSFAAFHTFCCCCCLWKCESALKLSFVWTWIMNPHKSSRSTHKHTFNWIFALTFSLCIPFSLEYLALVSLFFFVFG